ncbi:MAG: hypothetical protein ACP5NW_01420 [Candidatus Woesearchaeota archaeon]
MKNKKYVDVDYRIKNSLSIVVILMVLIVFTSVVTATTYYVDATNGSDSNDGLSLATAIKTITKMNTLTLYPGDSVLFKRGEMWRLPVDAYPTITSGNSSGYITYAAYGEGNRPLFLSSINTSYTNNWTDNSSNIWISVFTSTYDVGALIMNNETLIASKQSTLEMVDSQGEFYYNSTTDKIYIYSTSNPASYYDNIEVAWRPSISNIFEFTGKSYILFDNLDLRYGGVHGFSASTTHHINITNCAISFIGGSYQTGTLRYGNCIQFGLGSDNTYVINNTIHDCYDTGITHQAWDTGTGRTISNALVKNNIVYNCEYGYEYFNSIVDAGASTSNIHITQNTFINNNNNKYRNSAYGRHLMGFRSPTLTTNFSITNNIMYNATYNAIDMGFNANTNWLGQMPTSDYNLYYNNSPEVINMFMWNYTSYKTLATFTAGKGQEVHGIQNTNGSIFTDLEHGNYTPQAGSPACNMSSTGSYVGALPCAGSTPSNNAPTHNTPILNSSNLYNTTDATLYCYNQSTADADNDTVNNTYKWFRNNTLMSGMTSNSVNASNTTIGDSWKCEITPYDGEDNGTAKNSSALTINQDPDTVRVIFNSSTINNYSNENLTCYANVTGAINNMTVYYIVYNGSTVYSSGNKSVTRNILSTVTNVSSTMLIANQTWKCSIKASYNGVINESEWNNASITIRETPVTNNVPTHETPILNASDNPINSTNAILNCYNQSTEDADNDSIINTYRWFRNNTLMSGLTSNSVNQGNTSVGDIWKCEITPYDGEDNGTAKNSSALTILPSCGDGSCNGLENCSTCSADCGVCSTNISSCTLSNKSWNEDSSLNNAYNLSACFNDPLNHTLVYNVTGNISILVNISNGDVSLSAPTDWYGTEYVIFTATDNTNSSRYSSTNNVTLTVNSVADCGDDSCESGETCSNCESDCGECESSGGGGGGGGTYYVPKSALNTTANTSHNISTNYTNSTIYLNNATEETTPNTTLPNVTTSTLNDSDAGIAQYEPILEQPTKTESGITVLTEIFANKIAPAILAILLLATTILVVKGRKHAAKNIVETAQKHIKSSPIHIIETEHVKPIITAHTKPIVVPTIGSIYKEKTPSLREKILQYIESRRFTNESLTRLIMGYSKSGLLNKREVAELYAHLHIHKPRHAK